MVDLSQFRLVAVRGPYGRFLPRLAGGFTAPGILFQHRVGISSPSTRLTGGGKAETPFPDGPVAGFSLHGPRAPRTASMAAKGHIQEHAVWAGSLIERERRATGQKVETILDNLARRLGVEKSELWSLRYRPPRGIMVHVYMRLKAAYENEVERQEMRLAHELMLTKAVVSDANSQPAVIEAEAVLASRQIRPDSGRP